MTLTPDRSAPAVGSAGVVEIASTAAELGNRLTAWASGCGHEAEALRGSAALLSQPALLAALDAVGRSRSALERIEVELVREALARCLPREQGLSAINWVRTTEGESVPPPDLTRAGQTVRVATAANAGPGAMTERVMATWYAGGLSIEKATHMLRLASDATTTADPAQLAETIEALRIGSVDGPDPLAPTAPPAGTDPGSGQGPAGGPGSTDATGDDPGTGSADDATGGAVEPAAVRRSAAVPSWVTGMAPDPDLPWTVRTGTGPDNWGLTSKDLRTAIRYARRMLTPADLLKEEADAARRGRALHTLPGPGGLTDYQLTLDADGAALIDAAVSAFSRPRPTAADGTMDLRTAAHRRADALLEVVQRGLNTISEQPGQPTARVVVTIGLSDLLAQTNGAGITATGQVLTPEAVRRIACDAQIIPMILNGAGQPLDLGRGKRFFTDAQRTALFTRDRHCTFPGCTIPADWCDAHHLIPWASGGRTDLLYAALLCRLHHTLVHDHHLTATPMGVRWHLKP